MRAARAAKRRGMHTPFHGKAQLCSPLPPGKAAIHGEELRGAPKGRVRVRPRVMFHSARIRTLIRRRAQKKRRRSAPSPEGRRENRKQYENRIA